MGGSKHNIVRDQATAATVTLNKRISSSRSVDATNNAGLGGSAPYLTSVCALTFDCLCFFSSLGRGRATSATTTSRSRYSKDYDKELHVLLCFFLFLWFALLCFRFDCSRLDFVSNKATNQNCRKLKIISRLG
jgi:hypothetical protein